MQRRSGRALSRPCCPTLTSLARIAGVRCIPSPSSWRVGTADGPADGTGRSASVTSTEASSRCPDTRPGPGPHACPRGPGRMQGAGGVLARLTRTCLTVQPTHLWIGAARGKNRPPLKGIRHRHPPAESAPPSTTHRTPNAPAPDSEPSGKASARTCLRPGAPADHVVLQVLANSRRASAMSRYASSSTFGQATPMTSSSVSPSPPEHRQSRLIPPPRGLCRPGERGPAGFRGAAARDPALAPEDHGKSSASTTKVTFCPF